MASDYEAPFYGAPSYSYGEEYRALSEPGLEHKLSAAVAPIDGRFGGIIGQKLPTAYFIHI